MENRFVFIICMMLQLGHNCANTTTALLPCHVQNWSWSLYFMQNHQVFLHNLDYDLISSIIFIWALSSNGTSCMEQHQHKLTWWPLDWFGYLNDVHIQYMIYFYKSGWLCVPLALFVLTDGDRDGILRPGCPIPDVANIYLICNV